MKLPPSQLTFSPVVVLVVVGITLLLMGCDPMAISQQEQIVNNQTIIAGTPTITPTPTDTATSTITPSPTHTVGPTPTATATPTPSATPLPPTPTANPALKGFGFCEQTAGPNEGGRFSVRLGEARSEGFPAFERITFDLKLTAGSAPLTALAHCVTERDFMTLRSEPAAPGPYVLEVALPGWLHDDQFASSQLTRTLTFTNSKFVRNISFRAAPNADSGATILVALDQPVPFHLSVIPNPLQILIEVSRSAPIVAASDELNVAAGGGDVQSTTSLFLLYDGDIWRTTGDPGAQVAGDGVKPSGATPVIESPEVETALAVSPDGKLLAFCRTQQAGVDPGESFAAVPSLLWLANADGSNEHPLAPVGFNCADPVFSPDGRAVAFSVDETGATPTQRTIWIAPVAAGVPQRLVGGDEWSRMAPQWLSGGVLVYHAEAQDGRYTIFIRNANGTERDVGATLTGLRYGRFGEPIAQRDGARFAVEAERIAPASGADLLIFSGDGSFQQAVGSNDSARYWSRPLGWNDDGSLLFLATQCASSLVQEYALIRYEVGIQEERLAAGVTLGGFGDAVISGNSIAYTTIARPEAGSRGPLMVAPRSPVTLWLWDFTSGVRGKLVHAERGVGVRK